MLRQDPYGNTEALAKTLFTGQGHTPQFMPMDLYKVDDQYVLNADLPGVDPDSVDVSVDHGVLTITAERTIAVSGGTQWLTNERFTGAYRRQLVLGEGVDTERIVGSYDNGVLSLIIPLAEKAKPRKISIETTQPRDTNPPLQVQTNSS
ncbi:Hsp20/alpha crystallin family protein [Acaricomes phytoseiuli]|uniref:Hsp20/alpha crystallin family protein n=1 Tax=Acaricomes phytoseiuli TaxID=291968 RepID=UPI00222292F2|nr:Hsp20/alpha crystallin family protein [Acaricomes phytoseiuli]MCW1250699.1 Hsp20/alpha crystallin family protein [Acaricomes phytoseiuli]